MGVLDLEASGLLEQFPPVRCCVAYGSAVFQQAGYDAEAVSNALVDIVFVVDDAVAWHGANLQRNRGHYSLLGRIGGAELVANLQENYGTRIWYHTDIPTMLDGRSRRIKYGVISTADFVRDLRDWQHLFVAGRLHKPVALHVPHIDIGDMERGEDAATSNLELRRSLAMNLEHAVRCALLLLPADFHDYQLYSTIAGFSYAGDFRMQVGGENPHKVRNIVDKNILHFSKLYADPIRRAFASTVMQTRPWAGPGHTLFHQDTSPRAKWEHARALPATIRSLLGVQGHGEDWVSPGQPVAARALRASIRSIVARNSISQALKGVASAGVYTSVIYGVRKLAKGLPRIGL